LTDRSRLEERLTGLLTTCLRRSGIAADVMDTTVVKKPDVEASGQGRAAEVGAPYQARGEMGQLAAAPNELYSQKTLPAQNMGQ